MQHDQGRTRPSPRRRPRRRLHEEDLADGGHRYDVILDAGGNRPLSQLRRALTPHGTLVIVGGETGGRWLEGADRLLRAPLFSALVSRKLSTLITSENSKDLMVLRVLLENGEGRAGHRSDVPAQRRRGRHPLCQEGHARGKVVITV